MDSNHTNNDEDFEKRRAALAASSCLWKDRNDLDWLTERKDSVFPGWSDRAPQRDKETRS